jgi:hypothetical protein
MPADSLNTRPITCAGVDLLVDWAAAEGWNSGLHDANAFWATDPLALAWAQGHGMHEVFG